MATALACNMTAITHEERGAHHALIRRLMSQAVREILALANGLALRFPPREYDAVAEFVGRERLCCPFLTFTLDVTPDQGPLMLRVAGSAGVKDLIRAELGVPG